MLKRTPFFSLLAIFVALSLFSSDLPSEIEIWPGTAPGSESVEMELLVDERNSDETQRNRALSQITQPKLEVFAPDQSNGTAVVICPGGGYRYLSYDKEGVDVAKRLNEDGITVFVLSNRLPAEGHENASYVPLQDAQRAVRLVRHNATEWGINSEKIGIMGFSAGGHLASTLGTHFHTKSYEPADAIDEVSARPDFMILIYPVISMNPLVTHMGSRTKLLGETPSYSDEKLFSNELQVNEKTPPTFMVLASDDGAVPPENSIQFMQSLLKAGVPVELHSFENGGHGFGLRHTPGSTRYWPELMVTWMQHRGY